MTWKVEQRLQYESVGLRVFWVHVDGNGDLAVEQAFVTKEDALAYANGESGHRNFRTADAHQRPIGATCGRRRTARV